MNLKIALVASACFFSAIGTVFAQQEKTPVRIPAPDSMTAAAPAAPTAASQAVAAAPDMPPTPTPDMQNKIIENATAPAPSAGQVAVPGNTNPAETPVATPEAPAAAQVPAPVTDVTTQPTPATELPTEVVVAGLDATFVDKISAAINTKKFDEVYSFLAKDGFMIITPMGDVVSTEAAFRSMFDSMHGENSMLKNSTFTLSAESVTNLSPVLAYVTAKEVVTFSDNPTKKLQGMKSMLVKKEGDDWKIMAVQGSSKDIVEMMLPKPAAPVQPTLTEKMMMPIVAFVTGFILAFMIARRKKEQ